MRRLTSRRSAGLALAAAVLVSAACSGGASGSSSREPWGTQTVTPSQLAQELAGPDRPVVVCTAPPVMYRAGHIPGAVLHGPAEAPAVLRELVAWAKSLPKTSSLVIYCGCCPLEYCPNLRPAYLALKDLGFRQLRVLMLPSDFGTDWVRKGHAVER